MAGLGIDWSKYATMQPVAPAAPATAVGWSQRLAGQPQGAQPAAPAKAGLGIDWSKYATMQPAAPTVPPKAVGWSQRMAAPTVAPTQPPQGLLSRAYQGAKDAWTEWSDYDASHSTGAVIGNMARGALKSAANTARGLIAMGENVADPTALPTYELQSTPEILKLRNPAEKLGGGVEQAAEYLIPGSEAEKTVDALHGAIESRAIGKLAARMAKNLSEAGIHGATDASVATLQGNDPASAGITGALSPMAMRVAGRLLGGAAGKAWAPMAKRMASQGADDFTRTEMVAKAKQYGIPMTAAEATGSPLLDDMQTLGAKSLFGGDAEAKHNAAVDAGIRTWVNDLMKRISFEHMTPDQAGRSIQDQLLKSMQALRDEASQEFHGIHEAIGKNPVVNSSPIQQTAQDILEEFGPRFEKTPRELQGAKEAWAWVNDLAKDNTPYTFDQAQGLRSHLLELERNNPDLIKSISGGWYQRLAGSVDDAMMKAAGGLDPKLQGRFRDANALWEQLKNDFDSPRGPFYQAVRTNKGIQVPGMFLDRTRGGSMELLGKLMDYLQDPSIFRREFAERLVDPQATGNPSVHLVESRMRPYSGEFLDRVLGEDVAQEFRMLSKVAKETHYNPNPSGSGYHVNKLQDVTALGEAATAAASGDVGRAAQLIASVPGMKYLMGKFSFSPAVASWLSRGAPMQGMLSMHPQFVKELEQGLREGAAATAGSAGGSQSQP